MRPARGGDDRPPRSRVPVARRRRASRRCRPATRRATRTASTPSSPTSTTRSRSGARRTACPASRTACAPRRSPTPCSPRPRASRGSTSPARRRAQPATGRSPDEARLPHLLHARAQPRGDRRLGRRERLRGARARGVAAARRPPVHRQPRQGRRVRRRRGRARARARSTTTASSSRRSPTTTTTSIPTPPSATPTTRTCARASTRPPRSAACPVGTFIGRDPGRSVAENLREAERVFPPLVDYAGERGVKLMIENCVMEGWHPDGYPGNLAYSPELWEWMFELGLYLNFDPSHLLWLGIDPVAALKPYVDRVAHAHAKDAETFAAERNRYGFFGRMSTRESDPWDMGWWRYRIPGLGAGRLPPLRRHALRGRLRRRAVGRARGPGLGRHARARRGRAEDRPQQPPRPGDPMTNALKKTARPRTSSRFAASSRSTPASRRCRASTSTSARPRCTACSGPTAPASRRSSSACRAPSSRRAARSCSTASRCRPATPRDR